MKRAAFVNGNSELIALAGEWMCWRTPALDWMGLERATGEELASVELGSTRLEEKLFKCFFVSERLCKSVCWGAGTQTTVMRAK